MEMNIYTEQQDAGIKNYELTLFKFVHEMSDRKSSTAASWYLFSFMVTSDVGTGYTDSETRD
jgi:hypothetical protein